MLSVYPRLALILTLAWALAACGDHVDPAPTVAIARVIRGTLTLERESQSQTVRGPTRVEDGASATTSADGRASVVLDTGAWLLLDREASVQLALGRATLTQGRIWVDTRESDETVIETAQGTFSAAGGAFALSIEGTTTTVYCGAGEITYRTPGGEGSLPQGETLRVEAGSAPRAEPEALWEDWTGGLVDPAREHFRGVTPVGALGGRTIAERSLGAARAPLPVRSHEVNVEVRGDLAVTEVVQTFFNARSEVLEGEWAIRLPEGAIVQSFAVDMGSGFVESQLNSVAVGPGYQLAWAPLQSPGSKLTWDGPERLRARIHPIAAGATIRVQLRYTSWLDRRGGVRTYSYPMRSEAESPMLGEFVLSVDTRGSLAGAMRAGMGAISESGRVVLRRSDFRPHADFYLDLYDAEGSAPIGATAYVIEENTPTGTDDDEHDYVLVDVPTDAFIPDEVADAPLELVLLVDVSGATQTEDLEIARAVVEAVLRQLTPTDRVTLQLGDVSAHAPDDVPGELLPATAERREALLTAFGRAEIGGASDLGESLRQAATLVAGRPRGAVLYLGDAIPTTGALDATALRRVLGTVDAPPRMFGMAIGDGANADLLRALFGTRQASAVRDRDGASRAVMELLAEAARATLRGVQVSLGEGVERIYPRGPLTIGLGEHIRLVGRVVDQLPSDVVVRATRDGEVVERTLHLGRGTVQDEGDVRRRWASARLAELLDQDSGREALVELGTRFGLVTPWTSLVVGGPVNGICQLVYGFDHDPLAIAWGMGGGGASISAASLSDDEMGWRRRLTSSHAEAAVTPEATWVPRASSTPVDSAPSRSEGDGGLARASAERALVTGERGPRQCYERRTLVRPDLSGDVTVSVTVLGDGSVREARVARTSLSDSDAEQCITGEVSGLRFPATGGAAITVEHTFVFRVPDREFGSRRTCSEASRQPLETRRVLWGERLESGGSGTSAVLAVWTGARAACELTNWRARRTLLNMMLAHVGGIHARIQLYRAFSGDGATTSWLQRAILRGLRTPEDVSIARAGLDLEANVEWEVFSRLWWRDRTPSARLALVRRWLEVAPDEMDLRLRLLSLLEETNALPEARRLARELRADPLADAKVRTEVGEFWLRQSEEREARRVFSEIVEHAPLDPWARRRLGDLYRAHEWADDSYREYGTLARLRPGEGDVLLLLSRAAAAAGRVDEALRLEQRLSESTESGVDEGAAASARLWTLVRLFRLLDEELADAGALRRRLRETGALRDAPDVLVALTFAHPDDQVSLSLHWPSAEDDAFEDAPLGAITHGVRGIRIQEREPGDHLLEIRRDERESLRDTVAELWIIVGPGTQSPQVVRQSVTLTRERLRVRYRLGEDQSLTEVPVPPERTTSSR